MQDILLGLIDVLDYLFLVFKAGSFYKKIMLLSHFQLTDKNTQFTWIPSNGVSYNETLLANFSNNFSTSFVEQVLVPWFFSFISISILSPALCVTSCPEIIHIYCFSWLIQYGQKYVGSSLSEDISSNLYLLQPEIKEVLHHDPDCLPIKNRVSGFCF